MTNQDLAALRKSLDDIDAVLVSALGERARLARQIARGEGRRRRPGARRRSRDGAAAASLGVRRAARPRSRRSCAGSSARSWTTRCAGSRMRCRPARADAEQEITGGVPGDRRRLRPPGRAAALRRGAAARRLQGLRQLQGDARSGDRRPRRSRDAADRKHHGGLGLRVVRLAAAIQPVAGGRRDRRRAALPARRGGCADRIAAPHPLASAGAVAVQRVPRRRCASARA